MVTFKPRASSRQAIDAEARPFPSELTTPPVTKIYFALICLRLLRCKPERLGYVYVDSAMGFDEAGAALSRSAVPTLRRSREVACLLTKGNRSCTEKKKRGRIRYEPLS